MPTDGPAVISPDRSPLPTNVVAPLDQALQPTDTVIPPSRSSQATDVVAPSSAHAGSPPSMKEAVPSEEAEPSKQHLSRRTVVVGLAGITGLAAVGGGIAWLIHTQPLAPSRQGRGSPSAPASPSPIIRRNALYTYHGHSGSVWSVRWSPDGKRIASGSADGTVQVWDATTGGNVFIYRGQQSSAKQVTTFPGVQSAEWSPNGKRIASGSADGTVQVWDAATGGNVLTYQGHSGVVDDVAWSPDGKHIASANANGTAHVWNAATGVHLLTYSNQAALVNSVAWSPDGRRIASGGRDSTAQVWDAATGDHIVTYSGHSNSVYDVAWSPDGEHIASCSYDGTVQVWSASTGDLLLTYFQSAPVNDVAWSPRSKLIASGSRDSATTVQIWQAI